MLPYTCRRPWNTRPLHWTGKEKSTLEEIVSLLLDRVCNNFWVDIDRHDLCDVSMTWKLRRIGWTDVILL